ncbi:MAG: hypothetical protein ACKO5E_04810 [bacterium]
MTRSETLGISAIKLFPQISWKRSAGPLAAFLAVWLASGFFWQSRDWNVASRLMLVYSLGDRGSFSIDGLQRQTGDLAFKDGHYYCDKAPGFSLLATPSYLLGKQIFGWPSHPLNQDGFAWWQADAWVTWCSSGMASAIIAAGICLILQKHGLSSLQSSFCGILSIWASPTAIYATLAYGHQVASGLFITATAILFYKHSSDKALWPILAGLCCGLGVLTELAQAPLAIVIGLVGLSFASGMAGKARLATSLSLGALPTALILFGYNFIAFGSALDMGYFHHATQQFAKVHSADNPLGLGSPDLSRLPQLLWGQYRGLSFYAPWVVLAPIGWFLMLRNRHVRLLIVSFSGFLIPLWVNLSYPEWTGGWSTGPRLLVPTLPWLGLACGYSLQIKWLCKIAMPLYAAGLLVSDLFLSVGGRISQDIPRPLQDAILPIWLENRRPPVWPGELFARMHLQIWLGLSNIDPRIITIVFVIFQITVLIAIWLINRTCAGKTSTPAT